MGKTVEEKLARREQRQTTQATGLHVMVARRLTSPQRPWIKQGGEYSMTWQDISAYPYEHVEAEIVRQLGEHSIHGVTIERDIDDAALRIRVPEDQLQGRDTYLRVHVVNERSAAR